MTAARKLLHAAASGCMGAWLMAIPSASAADSPGEEALKTFRGLERETDVIQNRFFLKEGRFEISPMAGLIPNNPLVRQYVGGIDLAYHFREELAAQVYVMLSDTPTQNDLKGLTETLVVIAQGGAQGTSFQQPVDKLLLAATFAVQWAPVYGKINLVGETVLNFDIYGTLGVGVVTNTKNVAVYDNQNVVEGEVPVRLDRLGNKAAVPLVVGIGADFFLTQSIAIKADARSLLYIDKKPDYDPEDNQVVDENRLYNDFVATFGVAIFVPRMKPRITEF